MALNDQSPGHPLGEQQQADKRNERAVADQDRQRDQGKHQLPQRHQREQPRG
jgi:hypothetical protein